MCRILSSLVFLGAAANVYAMECVTGTLNYSNSKASQVVCVESENDRVRSQNCVSPNCSVRTKLAKAVKSDPDLKFKLVELNAGTPGSTLCRRLGLESRFTKVEAGARSFESWICYDKQDASFLDFDSLTDAIGFGSPSKTL